MPQAPLLPPGPSSIVKGANLGLILDRAAVETLADNLRWAWADFDAPGFAKAALPGLAGKALMDRGRHLATILHEFLPQPYEAAVEILLASLTPPLSQTEDNGLAVFFYLPHSFFIATYGLDPAQNAGRDPFEASLRAQHALTRRFTAEFCIRPFLIHRQDETLRRLLQWTRDPDPHVRRLCSEGTRPRLPWGLRLQAFVREPGPALPILEALRDDPELYVRRSVANHLGDIAKDHLPRVLEIAQDWSVGASPERRWLLRHALRYPAKQGHPEAQRLRERLR